MRLALCLSVVSLHSPVQPPAPPHTDQLHTAGAALIRTVTRACGSCPPLVRCSRLRYLTLTNCELLVLPPVVRGMAGLKLLKLNINRLQASVWQYN